jgi:hypothetical protein
VQALAGEYWTWLPISGYIGSTIGFGYYFNKARKTIQNSGMGIGYDNKHFLADAERQVIFDKTFRPDAKD